MKTNPDRCGRIFRAALLVLAISALPAPIFGYGEEGHKTVAAIADRIIAGLPNTRAQVRALLGNETLEHTAMWADTAKRPPEHPTQEMRDFIAANRSAAHDQHNYHYTDIPIQETQYRNNSIGATKIDVVHMIPNCIAILEGHSNATNNPTNIPKKTALRLLVHFVGDIHQPLHVGAAYFGPNARLVNPNTTTNFKADKGGQDVNFHSTNLHSYWDTPAVVKAMADAHAANPGAFADKIMAAPPQVPDSGSFMSGWAVKWATEIMPVSTAAHTKLTFHTTPSGKWGAQSSNLAAYDRWASAQVRTEIGRAGIRLAAILKKIWP
jgi:hypothetical protein